MIKLLMQLQSMRRVKGIMTKKQKYENYKDFLNDELNKDPVLAMAYLNEALVDEDQKVFLIALKDVIDAHGNDISALAWLE